jgi:hypothetical protein
MPTFAFKRTINIENALPQYLQCLTTSLEFRKNDFLDSNTMESVFKGTGSPIQNYLEVISFESPWYRHMAPDIIFNT